jgi:hypothetical protein
MAKRVLLAGILGGIVLFLWGFIAHEVLPLGTVGLNDLPNEDAVLNITRANISAPGIYVFPGPGLHSTASQEQKQALMKQALQKAATGPQGMIIYRPIGAQSFSLQLMTEAGANILQALLAAFLLAQVGLRRFSSRVGFVFVIGLLTAVTTNISYWNWYSFPTNYTISYVSYLILGYLFVGVVAAAIVKSSAGKAAAASA